MDLACPTEFGKLIIPNVSYFPAVRPDICLPYFPLEFWYNFFFFFKHKRKDSLLKRRKKKKSWLDIESQQLSHSFSTACFLNISTVKFDAFALFRRIFTWRQVAFWVDLWLFFPFFLCLRGAPVHCKTNRFDRALVFLFKKKKKE